MKIADNVYHVHESSNVYCTLVIGTEKALLIDTGFGYPGLPSIVRELTDLPIMVAYTHGHLDHVQVNELCREVYVHPDDLALYKKDSGFLFRMAFGLFYRKYMSVEERKAYRMRRPLRPLVRFLHEGMVIDLGGTTLRVMSVPGHTKGSVCFLDSVNRLVYAGDAISNHVWICLKESTSVREYSRALARVLAEIDDSWSIVASHSEVPLRRVVLARLIDCASRIDPARSVPYNNPFCKNAFLYGEGFEVLRDRYGIHSFEEMVQRIGEVDKDVFTDGLVVSVVYTKDKL